MKNTFQLIVRMLLLALFAIPLMANDSCSSALKDAEESSDKSVPAGDVSPDEAKAGDKVLPVLEEGSEKVLENSGPAAESLPQPQGE